MNVDTNLNLTLSPLAAETLRNILIHSRFVDVAPLFNEVLEQAPHVILIDLPDDQPTLRNKHAHTHTWNDADRQYSGAKG